MVPQSGVVSVRIHIVVISTTHSLTLTLNRMHLFILPFHHSLAICSRMTYLITQSTNIINLVSGLNITIIYGVHLRSVSGRSGSS
ncbi:hypothetical protein HanIR_Chr04g0173641 [Helianthus annuus]|nr:hypothetical protein HanIR_Chr04g0173641 [Helianthus annuus]